MSKRVCLAKISSAHGVKGFVKLLPYGEDPSLIESLGPAYSSETGDATLMVRIKNSTGKYMLGEIEGCNNRDQAEALRGTLLYYDRSLLPDIDDEESFYYDDLVGLKAIEDGKDVGIIKSVENFGAGELLEIKSFSGEEFFIPYTDDHIGDVDLVARTVIVKNHKDLIIG